MKQIFYKYILILISVLAVWLGGVPIFLSAVIPVICENLSYNTSYKITVENPHVYTSIIPVVYIKAKSVIIDAENSDDIFAVENLHLRLRLLPLLSGRIHLNLLEASNINIHSDIIKYPELDKKFFFKLQNNNFKCDSAIIKDFRTEFNERENNQSVTYLGKDVFFQKKERFIKFKIDSILKAGSSTSIVKLNLLLPKNNDAKSVIDIQLSNLDISPLGMFLKHYLPDGTENLSGIINIDADKNHLSASIQNGALMNKDSAKSIVLPDVLKLKSDFHISRKKFFINSAEITSNRINAEINGKISNFIDKSLMEVNINVRLIKSKVEDIVNMLPPFKTEDIDAYKLKQYKFYGDAIVFF